MKPQDIAYMFTRYYGPPDESWLVASDAAEDQGDMPLAQAIRLCYEHGKSPTRVARGWLLCWAWALECSTTVGRDFHHVVASEVLAAIEAPRVGPSEVYFPSWEESLLAYHAAYHAVHAKETEVAP